MIVVQCVLAAVSETAIYIFPRIPVSSVYRKKHSGTRLGRYHLLS